MTLLRDPLAASELFIAQADAGDERLWVSR